MIRRRELVHRGVEVLDGERRGVRHGGQLAMDSQLGRQTDRQVEIGAARLPERGEEFIDGQGGRLVLIRHVAPSVWLVLEQECRMGGALVGAPPSVCSSG